MAGLNTGQFESFSDFWDSEWGDRFAYYNNVDATDKEAMELVEKFYDSGIDYESDEWYDLLEYLYDDYDRDNYE